MNKKRAFLIISILLIVVTLKSLDLKMLLVAVKSLDKKYLSIGIVFYTTSTILRSIRWNIIFGLYNPLEWFLITCANIMSNNIYPARTGELTLFFLAEKVEKGKILSGLVITRLLDLISIGLIVLISSTKVATKGIHSEKLTLSLFLLIGALSLTTLILPKIIEYISNLLPLPIKLKDILDTFNSYYENQKNMLFKIFVVTVMVWITKYVSSYYIAESIFLPQNRNFKFWEIIFGVTLSELTTVLPFHTIGGFGSYETGWALAFMILGLTRSEAYSTGFIFHMTILLLSILMGLPSSMLINREKRGDRKSNLHPHQKKHK